MRTITLTNPACSFTDAMERLIAGECVGIKSAETGMVFVLHDYLGATRLRYMNLKDTEVPDPPAKAYLGFWYLVIADHRYLQHS